MSGMRRSLAAFVLALLCVVAVGTPATAATSWSKSTSGARGWGTYSRSNQTYTIPYSIKDTDADGDCAYVVFRPQIYYTIAGVGAWFSVGTTGYEYKDTVCGNGNVDTGTARINVWDKMNAADRLLATKMRMYIRVCEADFGFDTCSGFTTPPVDL